MTWGLRPRRHLPPPPGGGGDAQSAAGEDCADKITQATTRARKLRRAETASEHKLWQHLRRKQIHDVRFRRQFTLGPYIVDFVCLRAKLVIEVDGFSHTTIEQIDYDEKRTRWLNREGYQVLRFWNLDVLTNLDRVIERIDIETLARLKEIPPKFPPPLGGGGAARSDAGEDRGDELRRRGPPPINR
ncbi:MAG TPA: endonuclease domain-containing protein [Rhizomicrobium sp.]|jgi:very-short-patch-repair endonuclease|nr:endonuclease domain-containing protein [Rhizomicrobium sp.]